MNGIYRQILNLRLGSEVSVPPAGLKDLFTDNSEVHGITGNVTFGLNAAVE